jgi:hypothetical protein
LPGSTAKPPSSRTSGTSFRSPWTFKPPDTQSGAATFSSSSVASLCRTMSLPTHHTSTPPGLAWIASSSPGSSTPSPRPKRRHCANRLARPRGTIPQQPRITHHDS